jgi:hypothetical protein
LKFGNHTLEKVNALPGSKNKIKAKPNISNLNIIPENTKNGEMLNYKSYKKDEKYENNVLYEPLKKGKQKISNDFRELRLQLTKKNVGDKDKDTEKEKGKVLKNIFKRK